MREGVLIRMASMFAASWCELQVSMGERPKTLWGTDTAKSHINGRAMDPLHTSQHCNSLSTIGSTTCFAKQRLKRTQTTENNIIPPCLS